MKRTFNYPCRLAHRTYCSVALTPVTHDGIGKCDTPINSNNQHAYYLLPFTAVRSVYLSVQKKHDNSVVCGLI